MKGNEWVRVYLHFHDVYFASDAKSYFTYTDCEGNTSFIIKETPSKEESRPETENRKKKSANISICKVPVVFLSIFIFTQQKYFF